MLIAKCKTFSNFRQSKNYLTLLSYEWYFFRFKKIYPEVGKYCYRWMQEKYVSYNNMSPCLIIYNNYILLLRGNHWVAIRRSKGRPSQKDNSRCICVSDRKANIHVNTYPPYYWSDNRSRDKNDYLIFYVCTHRLISQQHILIHNVLPEFKCLSWLYFHIFP